MLDRADKLGVLAGMVALPLIFLQAVELYLDHCSYEPGCGEYENLILLVSLITSAAIAVVVGLAVAKTLRWIWR